MERRSKEERNPSKNRKMEESRSGFRTQEPPRRKAAAGGLKPSRPAQGQSRKRTGYDGPAAGPDKRRKKTGRKRKKVLRIFRTGSVGAAIFLVVMVWAVFVMRAAGKQQLHQNSVGSVSEMKMDDYIPTSVSPEDFQKIQEMNETAEAAAEKKEGRVYYNGKAYDFNRDIITFLVMGIDQRSETVQEQTEGFGAGSADTIFLVVLNPHSKKIQLVAIDRNTMTDVDVYDYYGEYEETVQAQICVQHGFGDGTVKSAEYMQKAVSNLLYGLPINGYCALNMSAIEKINDAVGGVDVVVMEDMSSVNRKMQEGASVHLEGKSAVEYVRYRNTNAFGSAEARLERQKQYISAFITKAKAGFKENPGLPVTLFQELRPYMTTDLNMEKVAYLAGMAAGFDFGSTDMCKIPGKTVMGDVYEEFYVDRDAMYELILKIFYEEAK